MIAKEDIKTYQYSALMRDENNLVILPHKLLRPYIANYTFCNPLTMPIQQTVLPSVSSTLVYAVGNDHIIDGLRGVNTKPTQIGEYARHFNFMFLIEFHPAGLYPFIKLEQNLLLDSDFSFEDICKPFNQEIIESYLSSNDIDALKHKLDCIFLSKLDNTAFNPAIALSIEKTVSCQGNIRSKELAKNVFYSEKQLNRFFQTHIGTNIKTFSRIVRIKYVADLLKQSMGLSELVEVMGYYDPSHLVHDFKSVYGITPKEYVSKMSLFYNDPFKLNTV